MNEIIKKVYGFDSLDKLKQLQDIKIQEKTIEFQKNIFEKNNIGVGDEVFLMKGTAWSDAKKLMDYPLTVRKIKLESENRNSGNLSFGYSIKGNMVEMGYPNWYAYNNIIFDTKENAKIWKIGRILSNVVYLAHNYNPKVKKEKIGFEEKTMKILNDLYDKNTKLFGKAIELFV